MLATLIRALEKPGKQLVLRLRRAISLNLP